MGIPAEIVFPPSTQPSVNATENGGRLINAFAEKAPPGSRSEIIIRRCPGLRPLFSVGLDDYRGALLVGSILYVANGDTVYTVTQSGSSYAVAALTGTLPGTGFVMMERNMRSPTPQILILHSAGKSQIDSGAVSDFSDPDLPDVNSLCFLDGYFGFTTAAGEAIASGVNDDTISGLDFATAEAAPDGLVRGVARGSDLLLMGDYTTEFWADAGNATGFPFTRGPVITVGLFGLHAVAGMASDRAFTGDMQFVGSDRRVYRLQGYSPVAVSTPYIEALLQAITDPDDLEASVYSVNGHPCWVLSSASWTIVYDQATGLWHERASYGATRWRALGCINAFGQWLAFERGSNAVYTIDPTYRREAAEPLVWETRSTQKHRFPARFVVNSAAFDFVTGVGVARGIAPIETDPTVLISWSDDGGRTFGTPLIRRLGGQGEANVRIGIGPAGLAPRQGRQWRLQVSDPVEVALLGGAMDVDQRDA